MQEAETDSEPGWGLIWAQAEVPLEEEVPGSAPRAQAAALADRTMAWPQAQTPQRALEEDEALWLVPELPV